MVNRASTHAKIILGAVLAGGKSSRMGVDKALLSFGDRTLLQSQYEKMSSVLGGKNVVVSGNYPAYEHVVDLDCDIGPLGGIFSVIKKFGTADFFLFLPVDMPNMSENTLLALVEAAIAEPLFDCWTYRNFEMPLIIKNNKSLEPILAELLLQEQSLRSIRKLIQLMRYRLLSADTIDHEFLNANTMKDWSEVLDEYSDGF